MEPISKALVKTELYRRDMELYHSSLEEEMKFYDAVKRGDRKTFQTTYQRLGGEGSGVLSQNPLQNLKYHFVISVAFVTRFCVEGGMEREEAFNLSDLYIRTADRTDRVEKLHELHYKAMLDYTERMHRMIKQNAYPMTVVKMIEYITNNLQRNFKLQEMAAELHFSVPYLSTLFHKETGMTIVAYARKKRIETAKRLLMYTDTPSSDIAQMLAFSSHSHFISSFREEEGMTPRQFREKHYRQNDAMRGGVQL